MDVCKENVPLEAVKLKSDSVRRHKKGVSGIPVAVSRRNKTCKVLQDVKTKLNEGTMTEDTTKHQPAKDLEEFVPDPQSLEEILEEKPITKNKPNPRDSKYFLPLLDDTPACVRLSVYRNKLCKNGGKTPTYSNHRTRIDYLCERAAQSTAALFRRMHSRTTSTCMDDLKLDLNSELSKAGSLVRSPSHPSISREAKPDIPRSPSLPELRPPTHPIVVNPDQSDHHFIMTPLRTSRLKPVSSYAMLSSAITDQLYFSRTHFYDIDNELVSILKAAPKPCGLSRTDCPNPLAQQLTLNY